MLAEETIRSESMATMEAVYDTLCHGRHSTDDVNEGHVISSTSASLYQQISLMPGLDAFQSASNQSGCWNQQALPTEGWSKHIPSRTRESVENLKAAASLLRQQEELYQTPSDRWKEQQQANQFLLDFQSHAGTSHAFESSSALNQTNGTFVNAQSDRPSLPSSQAAGESAAILDVQNLKVAPEQQLLEATVKSRAMLQPQNIGAALQSTNLSFSDPFASSTASSANAFVGTGDKGKSVQFSGLEDEHPSSALLAAEEKSIQPAHLSPRGKRIRLTAASGDKVDVVVDSETQVTPVDNSRADSPRQPSNSRKRVTKPRASKSQAAQRSQPKPKATSNVKGKRATDVTDPIKTEQVADSSAAPVVPAVMDGAQTAVEQLMLHQPQWLSSANKGISAGSGQATDLLRQKEQLELEQMLCQDTALTSMHQCDNMWSLMGASNLHQAIETTSAAPDNTLSSALSGLPSSIQNPDATSCGSSAVCSASEVSLFHASSWQNPPVVSSSLTYIPVTSEKSTVSWTGSTQSPESPVSFLSSSTLNDPQHFNYATFDFSNTSVGDSHYTMCANSLGLRQESTGQALSEAPLKVQQEIATGFDLKSLPDIVSLGAKIAIPKNSTCFTFAYEEQNEQPGWYVKEQNGTDSTFPPSFLHPRAEFAVRPLLTGVVAQLHNDWLDHHTTRTIPQSRDGDAGASKTASAFFPHVEPTLESRHVRTLWQELEQRRMLQLTDPTLIARFEREALEELRKEAAERAEMGITSSTSVPWSSLEPSRQEVIVRAQEKWQCCRSAATYTVGLLRQAEYCMAQSALAFLPLRSNRKTSSGHMGHKRQSHSSIDVSGAPSTAREMDKAGEISGKLNVNGSVTMLKSAINTLDRNDEGMRHTDTGLIALHAATQDQ